MLPMSGLISVTDVLIVPVNGERVNAERRTMNAERRTVNGER